MFPLIFGALASAGKATVTFTESQVDGVDRGTYTFSSVSLGTASSDRSIFIFVGHSGAITTSSVTVAGNAATSVISENSGTGTAELWRVDLASGTSGDVVVSLSGTADRCSIGVWASYGLNTTAHATASAGDEDPFSEAINCPANGFIIVGCAHVTTGTKGFTAIGVDEDFDEETESGIAQHWGGSKEFPSAQTGLAVGCDPASNTSGGNMVAASYGPV